MTADTSVVIAALSAWHERHELAARALAEVDALPGHVLLESYSVLTRPPGGLAVEPELAARVLRERFPRQPLTLDRAGRSRLTATLAAAGVHGGSACDGLVALEAHGHRQTLLTLDEGAQTTYRRLAIEFAGPTA